MRLLATLLTVHLLTPALAHAAPLDSKVDTGATALNVRSGPGTDQNTVGTIGDGDVVTVHCQAWGEEIEGTQRKSPLWNRIGTGRYIADAFVVWHPARPVIPWCGQTADAVTATVSADTLNVRSGPGFGHGIVGTVSQGTAVQAACLDWGSKVTGHTTSAVWLDLGDGRHLSEAYVKWAPQRPWLPWCGQAPPVVTSGRTADFIAASVGPAQETQRAYRVPASVTIAQAILESGWGRSTLTRDDHNYFGKKCFGDPGPVAIGCRDYATHECSGRDCWPTRDDFRAYRNPTDSYTDHGRQLTELSRYAEAMKHTGDPDRFAREIHKAGYATGSAYADKLIELMKQYDLYRYDKQSG